MRLLDRFEQFLERLLEGTTGALFRQKLQPAEIGKKLERAMLDNQKASVGSSIVPNAYTVRLNPKDYSQIESFAAGLSRQMESWLFLAASRRELTVLDKITVEFTEDVDVPQRHPRIDALISDHIHQQRSGRRQAHAYPSPPVQPTSIYERTTKPASSPRLITESGTAFDIPEGESTIGRSPDNTIVIDSPDVSRRHAKLERSGQHVRVQDLQSTNGTRVNGEAIFVSDVQDGDTLQIGSQVLELHGASTWDTGRRRP